MVSGSLYRLHELAFRTQYAELKERTLGAGPLLPGTPGSLQQRTGTGYAYWYRVYYPVPGKQAETLIGPADDLVALDAMRERMDFAEWSSKQVSALRKLGFQVADKSVGRVLVELHNLGAFEAGLTLVGTLAYMAWLNEFGVIAVSARTQDIDLARRQRLKLAAPLHFLETMRATGLPFVAVPGLPSTVPSTSVKLPGVQGLRIDLLAPGEPIGRILSLPELDWAAQAVPYYDYLLDSPESGALLAGGHCIPVRLPQPARLRAREGQPLGHRGPFRQRQRDRGIDSRHPQTDPPRPRRTSRSARSRTRVRRRRRPRGALPTTAAGHARASARKTGSRQLAGPVDRARARRCRLGDVLAAPVLLEELADTIE